MRFPAFWKKKRTHLDYAATTPVSPEVFRAMKPYFCNEWANPSALYKEGVRAKRAVDEARGDVARTLRVRAGDITFTSGGTEANNLALIGVIEHLKRSGRAYEHIEIISTHIEHPSILGTLEYLESRGVVVRYVPVFEDGRVDMDAFETLLNEKTALVSIGYVNAEVGVVQDLKKLTRTVRKWNDVHHTHVLVHTDACQAPLWLSCALDTLGVDLMSLDAGKCYGPKGVGVLVHRHWVGILPATLGGGQEGGLRSGTENVPLIVGCAKALTRAQAGFESRSARILKLRDALFARIGKEIPGAVLNGSREHRVANNVHISLPHIDTEYATLWLDARGVCVSTRSACGGTHGDGSHVVREMTGDATRAQGTLRFTLGEESTEGDTDTATQLLKDYVQTVAPHQNLTS